MNKVTITIIGAGQIGSRHLQALALLDRPSIIQVVDPSSTALQTAQKRFAMIKQREHVHDVRYLHHLSKLTSPSDIAIIATDAHIRFSVVKTLLMNHEVRYLLLEKVLFQKVSQYDDIMKLLIKKNIKAWVNCPLRTLSFFKNLKSKMTMTHAIDYRLSGSLWGIGSNAIHHLDLFSYLTDQPLFTLNSNLIDDKLIPSKRKGFNEFTGTLLGATKEGSLINLTSYAGGNAPLFIQISSDQVRCFINMTDERACLAELESGWKWKNIESNIPLQSQLTHMVVQEIVDVGDCDLPTYEESAKLHLALLEALLFKLIKGSTKEVDVCPIT